VKGVRLSGKKKSWCQQHDSQVIKLAPDSTAGSGDRAVGLLDGNKGEARVAEVN
jgi:hypothetical protein